MRVLHLLASTGWGGAERIACTLHRLTEERGHVSRLEGPALPALVRGVSDEAGQTLPAASWERRYAYWAFGARRRTKAYAPDLVHVHLATPGLTSAAWFIARATPMVVTFHLLPGTTPWANDYLTAIRSQRVLRALGRRARGPVFVAVSAGDRAKLQSLFPGVRTELAMNAPPLPPMHAQPPAELPFPTGVLRLLSVGRLGEQKGFDRMVKALSDPRVRDLPWHWILVGTGKEHAALEASVAAHGLRSRVTFAGFLPADHLFEQADLILCPSRYEGMPLVPLEALLAGKPLLLSRIPAHLELLGEAPGSFLPEDDGEWAAALLPPLSDAGVRDRLRAAQGAVSRIDPRERLLRDYLRIYEGVLADSS
jgi:glycosyltransferase involved in cell wall biosynthesis